MPEIAGIRRPVPGPRRPFTGWGSFPWICVIVRPPRKGNYVFRQRRHMANQGTTTAEVKIFGATYHVRGENDFEYLQMLADLVDTRMKEVAKRVATVDTAKIAILAALNLADELFQCRKVQEGEREAVTEKVAELADELEAALQGS